MSNYFLYVRKSTDTEDKQVRSIEDQLAVLRSLARSENLTIATEFIEKQSAKRPGRPVFGEMLKRLSKGDVQGILCWKLDRLARNPVDAAQISWLLQEGVIQHIQTFEKSYYPEDNVLMMQVEFGMANQYIRDLSVNTKRGMQEKAKRGEYPGLAPVGYINDLRTKTIVPDRKKAAIIKTAFKLYAQNQSRLEDISAFFASHGLLSRDKLPFKRDKIARLLSNPLYCGLFQFSGETYQGNHKPIISKQLFDDIQKVLKYRSRPHHQAQNNPQALCGLFKCGECGRSITAEEKTKHQQNGNIHKYTYYRCTKKNTDCSQPYIREEALVAQLSVNLKDFTMPKNWVDELARMADKDEQNGIQEATAYVQTLRSKNMEIDSKLQRLLNLYLDQDMEQEAYRKEKNQLTSEKQSLEEQITCLEKNQNVWLEPLRNWLKEAQTLGEVANAPSLEDKKRAVQSIAGSNLFLKDKEIALVPKTHWAALRAAQCEYAKNKNCLVVVRLFEVARTYFLEGGS